MQVHVFSDLEGLRIAAEMERRGGEFYKRSLKIVRTPHAKDVLEQLAADEAIHQREFSRLYLAVQKEKGTSGSAAYDMETNALLSAIASDIVFPGGMVALARELEHPTAVLQAAIQSEKDSIKFYDEMIRKAGDDGTRQIFAEVVLQERAHLAKLEQMLLNESL